MKIFLISVVIFGFIVNSVLIGGIFVEAKSGDACLADKLLGYSNALVFAILVACYWWGHLDAV